MKFIALVTVFVFSVSTVFAQISDAIEEFALPDELNESSGIIFFNNKLLTHNDSGGENKLYELDVNSGLVTRTVTVLNTTNVDWEDLTQDDSYIYIGDFGNYAGDRTDLKIYKISKTDYLNSTNVSAEIISFNYVAQTSFTNNENNTEWDAESLISFNTENLMLFSRNWINGNTKAYLIPKTAGNYALNPLPSTLNSGGLTSGATYNSESKKLFLIGYTQFLQPFVWESENFTGIDVFSGTNTQISLSANFGFEQIEGITDNGNGKYFITSETFSNSGISDYGKLISFSEENTLSINNDVVTELQLFPNPVNTILSIKTNNFQKVEIFNTKGALLHSGNSKTIDMQAFNSGIYFVKITENNNTSSIKKIIKK